MKNSTFKNFNLKKTIIASFFLVMALFFSGVISSTLTKKVEVINVYAIEQTQLEDKEYLLELHGYRKDEVSTSGVVMNGGTGFTWQCDKSVPSTVSGGTTFVITSANKEKIIMTVDGTAYTFTLNLFAGYQLNGYEFVSGDNAPTSVDFTKTSYRYTTEALDPNYSGSITISASVTEREYKIDLYYENSSNSSYTYKTVDPYTVTKSLSIGTGHAPTDGPTNKSFIGWYYGGQTGSYNSSKYSIARNGNDYVVTATGVSVSITIDPTNQKGGFYLVSSVKGYGEISQVSNNPLIFALWTNKYSILVDNSSSYWNSASFGLTNAQKLNLRGVGTSSSASTSQTLTGITYASTIPFANSVYNGKGLSFMEQTEVYANGYNGYYVYNYGHYVTGYTINVNGSTWSGTYSNLGALAAAIDAVYYGNFGVPSVTITPTWAKSKINTSYSASLITFGSTYNLGTDTVNSGQSFFAYTYDDISGTRYTSSHNLIAPSKNTEVYWNYKDIPSKEYTYNASASGTAYGSVYNIDLSPVGLDNVYRVDLNNVHTNVDGKYEIEANEDGTYTYPYYSTTGGYAGLTNTVLTYSNVYLGSTVRAYSSSNYIFADLYGDYLESYAKGYYSQIDGGTNDYGIFNYLHYSSGTVSGNVLTATNPEFWIYLANGQDAKELPMFANKYLSIVYWTFDKTSTTYGLVTDAYKTTFEPELDGTVLSTNNNWTYQYFGTEAYAYSMKRINLYFLEDNSSTYTYIQAKSFGKIVDLDFGSTSPDPAFNRFANRIFGGWVFDTNVAQSAAYGYSVAINGSKLTATSKDGTRVTEFTIEKINDHDTTLVYVTTVKGDMFVQEDNNPIITMRDAFKYDFVVDNTETYWSQYNETKQQLDLYGAAASEDNDAEQALTVSFKVADNVRYAYPFMSSRKGADGLAFYSNDFKEANAATVATNKSFYYVYNYGHEIIGWEIDFRFTNNPNKNGTVLVFNTASLKAFEGDNTNYCDINAIVNSVDVREIARAIDDYMLANRIDEIPTVTMKPKWEGATIVITVDSVGKIGETTFGNDDYSLNVGSVSIPTGQSLFTFKEKANNFISAPTGRWNYMEIPTSSFQYTIGYSHTDGKYSITLSPVFVDNIYKVKLDNAINIEENKYQLEAGEFKASTSSHVDELTFKNYAVLDETNNYIFTTYEEVKNDIIFIDDYISGALKSGYKTLTNAYETYLEGIDGDGSGEFTVLGKTFTNIGTISSTNSSNDTLTVSSQPNFFIYLANHQATGVLPEFMHDLSMLVHWQNASNGINGYKTYVTSKYDEDLHKNELRQETSNSNYAIEPNWDYLHGGSKSNFTLRARYVFSVRMYYSDNNTSTNGIYQSVNSNELGHFGKYTEFNLLENGDFLIEPKSNPTDKTFERWVFDKQQAENSGYSISVSGNKITATADNEPYDDKWVFEYDGINTFNSNYYYITKIHPSYTRFNQTNTNPIIFAKWATLFDTTIDNTDTYWNDVDSNNKSLFGAYSTQSEHPFVNADFRKTTFKTANDVDYAFDFITSEKDGEGLSFHHLSDWQSTVDLHITSNSGSYYVFNYGHYISHYAIRLEIAGTTYYFIKTGSTWSYSKNPEDKIILAELTYTNMKEIARVADELALSHNAETGKIVIVPKWAEVRIDALLENSYWNSGLGTNVLTSTTFANKLGYVINTVTTQVEIAHSITNYYYDDNVNYKIASVLNSSNISGVWNYRNIAKENFSYTRSGVIGSGIYSITLKPYYVDDVFKVNLNNAVSKINKADQTKTYTLINCEFEFNNEVGAYNNYSLNRLNFRHKLDEDYTFTSYENETLMDSYIDKLAVLISTYEAGISTENMDCFDIFKTVYYTNTNLVNVSAEDLTVPATADVKFHIYLANDKMTGSLPVFKKDYYALIFWQNDYTNDAGNQYIYTTDEYNPDLHAEESGADGREMHVDADAGKWFFTDGYGNPDIISFTALYYRKNYELQVYTINKDNLDEIERRGYVRINIFDQLHDEDPTIENTGGDYLIIYNGSEMLVYDYVEGIASANSNYPNNVKNAETLGFKNGKIRLYEGCYVTMSVFDQSQDAHAMSTGHFDDMIGYKFANEIVQKISDADAEGKGLFGSANADNSYVYEVDPETVKNKGYTNREVLQVYVRYTRIIYTLTFKMDNNLAGEFNLWQDTANTGYITAITLDEVAVHHIYKVDYYANAGFKHENYSFVLSNGMNDRGLQEYDEASGNMSQEYLATYNYYNDNTLDGTWLRKHFYVDYTNYDVSLIELGTLWVKTDAIEFNYGVKVYDNSNMEFANVGYIIESPTTYDVSLKLEETTGVALTPETYTYLKDDNHDFYYYLSADNVEYALLSTRMFFTNDHETTLNNFYTTYSFLLKDKPVNQATLRSEHLSKMVTNYEEGKIIAVDDRNIYIMLEVRKLLKVDMSVAAIEYDSNSSVRTTTLTNADNNHVKIKIDPGAAIESSLIYTTSSMVGYFKTTDGTTTVRAYTYYGLENVLNSEYDKGRYSKVEYFLNGEASSLTKNTFEVQEDSTLLIKYIPESMTVDFVYMLEGAEVEEETVQGLYITDKNKYKPNPQNIYRIGEYLTYLVECIDVDYNVVVTINHRTRYSTNSVDRAVKIIEYTTTDANGKEQVLDNRYEITNYDYSCGKIRIEVNVVAQNKEKIHVQYQLNDDKKVCADDYYGTFDVYENLEGEFITKAESVETADIAIVQGRDVYVTLNIPFGYQYVGIRYSSYVTEYIEPTDGKIKIIGDFNPETHGGDYFIMLGKRSVSAILNTNNVNINSKYAMLNHSNNTGWRADLTGLYVGSVVEFKSEPSIQERLDYFYYLDKDGNEVPLKDDNDNPLMKVTITSEMLEKINNTVIEFGVAVVEQCKLEVLIDELSKKNIAENGYVLENKTTSEEYKSGDYVDVNTEITIETRTIVEGKYDITLLMQAPGNPNNLDGNVTELICDVINKGDVVIKLNQDYVYTLTVTPKQYTVNVEENLYTTLTAVQENKPNVSVDEENQVNQITTVGQKYNEQARLTFIRKTEDRELSAVFISNNDNTDDLVIEFTNKTHIVYKIVEGNKQIVNLMEYGFVMEVTENQVALTYTTYNNIDIRFDYKEYKVISA